MALFSRALSSIGGAGLAIWFSASGLCAAQHCVICSAPDVTYLCEADGGVGVLAGGGGKFACITELAKRGGHDSCSVIKRQAARCDGLTPTVLFPGASDAPATGAPTQPNNLAPANVPVDPSFTADPQPPSDLSTSDEPETFVADDDGERDPAETSEEKKAKGPPKTVEELANQTVESSKKGLNTAGKVVTDTAKKTGEQIGKAGSAVGSAAKKTWDCVTSLFSDC